MLKVNVIGHDYYYGLTDIIRLFWNGISEKKEDNSIICTECEENITIFSKVSDNKIVTTWVEFLDFPDKNINYNDISNLPSLDVKRELKRQLYILLSHIMDKKYPWGCLTGIRPTIIAGETLNPQEMSELYLVREDKAKLAFEVKENEDKILSKLSKNDLNIYVGIPFCPSRCEYCSFVSQDIGHHLKRLNDYEESLIKEISLVGKKINRRISSLYIGGGTPTVFEDKIFEHFIRNTIDLLPIDSNTEITIEAGRPDTITDYKLDVIKDLGVRRICINPQTMNNNTLKNLNRKHTSEDIIKVFEEAKARNIDVINMDLIAGLKYEEPEELINSLNRLIELNPANITIHTLYKKRRSAMKKEDITSRLREDEALDYSVSKAYNILKDNGYIPYYMYRQKDTGHGLENVGFAKEGTECLYNVAMMTDGRDVLSFGAGGMSKRVFEETSKGKYRLERHSCVKDVLLYMENVNEIAQGKCDFFEL